MWIDPGLGKELLSKGEWRLTNCLWQSVSWDTGAASAHKKFHVFNGTGRFATVFTKPTTWPCHEPDEVSADCPVVCRFSDKWVPVTGAWRGCCSQVWKTALNVLNKQSRTADNRWSSSTGVEGVAISLRCKVIKMLTGVNVGLTV